MGLFDEVRQAARSLSRAPGFATIAIVTLALGIGANTAIFSVVNQVLLAPLPYPNPESIVSISTVSNDTGRKTPRLTGGDLLDIQSGAAAFDAIAYYYGGEMGVQVAGRAEFTGTFLVTPTLFAVFGVHPIVGRAFDSSDADRAAVIDLPFAERNFGSGAAALGKSLSVENRTYEIVGIVPAGFQFPSKAHVWIPAPAKPTNLNRTAYNYPAVAKLHSGVTIQEANSQLQAIGTRLAGAFPASNSRKSFAADGLREQLTGSVRSTLYLLLGAVALVLLIACTNVADMMLARATGRSREMAVRTALGAGRWHVVRPLLAESFLLAVLGGGLGVLLAEASIQSLPRYFRDLLPASQSGVVQLDTNVLLFASAITMLACLMFGVIPALQAGRVDLNDALKQGGSRGLLGGGSARLRNGLVVAQIAMSCVLAVAAGLLLRSFYELTNVKLGYRTDGILVMYAHAPARTLDEYVGVGRLFENIFGQISGIPGVSSVAGAMGLPTGQYGSNGSYAVEGKHVFAPGQKLPHATFSLASPAYFSTMGIPLRRGREFDPRDQYDAPFVAIVSEALARETFPNEDPIGKRIQCGLDSPNWMTVVGIAGDVRQDSPASSPGPTLYMPLKQHPFHANELQVVVRTAVAPGSLTSAVRDKVRGVNPDIATKFTTMETMLGDSVAKPRLRTFLIGSFAGLALLLAMVGVYGVMSYMTVQRTSEFGLRVALGASTRNVAGLVLGRAFRLAAIGLVVGLLLSIAAGRAVSSMLFGIKPGDPLTYVVVLLAIAPIVLLAAWVPAWRATKVDPLSSLRNE